MGNRLAEKVNQLQATVSKMEVALGAIADAVVFLGEDKKVQWCNPAFNRLVNRSHSAVIGSNFSDILPLMQAGKPVNLELDRQNDRDRVSEYEFQQGNDNLILEISGNSVESDNGERSVVLIIRDVSQTKITEIEQKKALEEREEYLSLLRATLESTADGILVISGDRNAPVYNQKFLQMWRMPESLVLPGKGDERLKFLAEQTIDPEAFVAKIWDLFFHHPEAVILDLVELKDGRIFERYTQPQWNGDRIIGRVWNFRDITEQKRTEQRLRFAQFALDSISDNVGYCDENARIHYVNEASCRMLGYPREKLIGMTVQDIDPNYPIETWPDHWRELKEKRCITFETTVRSQQGNLIPMEVTANYLEFDGLEYDLSFSRDITERKKAEEALRRSELKFRNLFENSQVGIFRTRVEDGLILDANQHYIEIAGYSSAEEVIGKRFTTEFYVNLSDRQRMLSEVFRFGEVNNFEMQFRRKDGTIRWGLYSIRLNREENCLEGVFTDISDRKLAEAALRESEAKFRRLFENSLVGIVLCRLEDGLILDANQRFIEFTGYTSAAEVIGKKHTTDFYINPEQRQSVLKYLLGNAVLHNYEVQFRRKNGEILWLLCSVRLNLGQSCLEAVVIDISARKRAEAALLESEFKFRTIVENANDIIYLQTLEGIFTYISPNITPFLGYSETEIVGKSLLDLTHPDDLEICREALQRAAEFQEKQSDIEFRATHKNGSYRWINCNLTLIENPRDGFSLLGIARDITERKIAEEALRRSELKYRNIFQNSLVGIGRSRLEDGLFLDANLPCAEIIGYSSAAELIGKRYAGEFQVDSNTRPSILAALEQHGEVRNLEMQLRRKDGTIRWGLFSARLNVEQSCLEFMIVDISDRKRLEEELRQSQQFLDSIINNIPLALFVKDINNDFRYVLINKISEKFLGFSRETAIGLNDGDLIPKEQADYFGKQDLAAVAQRTMLEIPELTITRNGESILARVIKFPLFDERDNPTHLLCIAEDITERKHREQALRLIVEGTAAKTGDDFFHSCVRYLALVLRVRYAVVTQFADETKTKVRTLAFWQGETFAENFEYSLHGTPCENILTGKICHYSQGIQALFPEDSYLAVIGVESYLGIPLIDSTGEILGHIAVLDVKPMEKDPGRELILKIFAARAGAELERKQAEEALERRARVESLLSCISRQFIDRDANTALNFTLEAIARFIDAERSCIFELVEEQKQICIVNEWCADGVQPLSGAAREGDVTAFPWFHNQIFNGEAIKISSAAELPPEAVSERQMLQNHSIQSIMAAPMIHSGKVVGFLGADVVHFSKTWTQEDISLLKLVGEVIAIGRARQKAEEALRVAKEAAEAANFAKSTFLANMSHELRTPLNAILGFSQLMERDTALTQRQRESLAIINRSGEHLLHLINDVLEMSKIEAGRIVLHPAPFDLHRLLQTIQEMFQVRTEAKRLSLQFDIAPDLPQYVFTDEGKLRQVLINLLSNAVKFTETGGVVLRVRASGSRGAASPGEGQGRGRGESPMDVDAVAASRRVGESDGESFLYPLPHHCNPNPITPSLQPQPHYPITATPHPITATLLFEIQDTGIGIALEEMDNLFQAFVQTKSGMQAKEGTGLGLAITREFVRLMGGDICVTSTAGEGTTFRFNVQVTLADGEEVAPSSSSRRVLKVAPDQPTYRILVVDDRSENRELMAQLLNTVGFETRTATNGIEAIALWQTWHPHLIWMDMRMPVMDGYEATRQIRMKYSNSSSPKIIALTASAFEEQRTNIIAAGCDDLVRKPFRELVIFEKMAEHLGVRYIYEEEQESTRTEQQSKAKPGDNLKSSDLAVMPAEWIAEVHRASVEADSDRLIELIEQIPPSHQALAEGLADLVRRFCFEEIQELTQL